MEYRELEQQIANEILRIQRGAAHIEINPERAETIIRSVELEQGFEYTEEQRTAIWNTLNNQFSILTGSAGVGKVVLSTASLTSSKPIIFALRKCLYRVVLPLN